MQTRNMNWVDNEDLDVGELCIACEKPVCTLLSFLFEDHEHLDEQVSGCLSTFSWLIKDILLPGHGTQVTGVLYLTKFVSKSFPSSPIFLCSINCKMMILSTFSSDNFDFHLILCWLDVALIYCQHSSTDCRARALLGGQINDPILFCSSQKRMRLSQTLKGFLSWHSIFQGPQPCLVHYIQKFIYTDTVRCGA